MSCFSTRYSLVLGVALRVAASTAVVGALLFALIYQAVADMGRAGLKEAINTDIAGLVDVYAGQGREGLTMAIAERLDVAPSVSEAPYYRLTDNSGVFLAGNFSDALKANLASSSFYSMAQDPAGEQILVRATRLRGGLALSVGRSHSHLDQALAQLKFMFGAALLIMVAAAFGIGTYASLRLRGRITSLNTLFEDMIGPAQTLGPSGRAGDEIDYLERHVRDAANRIKRLLAAQRDISDNIAHETRTPLMMLENHLQRAIEQADRPELVASLQAASARTQSMVRLLDALLDIASAEAQRGDLKGLDNISLSEVARSISELYAASAEAAGVDLVCEIEGEVFLRADAMQMSRLMVNLLDNAFKYGASGTFIKLKVAAGPVIVVEDDGPGIPEAARPKIFERYQRGVDRGRQGHGLGLALVQAIAARYGLGARLEAGDGGGARFVVAPE